MALPTPTKEFGSKYAAYAVATYLKSRLNTVLQAYATLAGINFPTLLDAAGVDLKPADTLDGQSLMPLFRGQALSRDALFFHYPNYAFHKRNKLCAGPRQIHCDQGVLAMTDDHVVDHGRG